MAEYIEDTASGSYNALLSGTYTTDAIDKTISMSTDGQADTGFTFPTITLGLLI